MTNCTIRPLTPSELPLLADFLYYAIFVPEGIEAPPREIVNLPELQVYIRDFGAQPHDAPTRDRLSVLRRDDQEAGLDIHVADGGPRNERRCGSGRLQDHVPERR